MVSFNAKADSGFSRMLLRLKWIWSLAVIVMLVLQPLSATGAPPADRDVSDSNQPQSSATSATDGTTDATDDTNGKTDAPKRVRSLDRKTATGDDPSEQKSSELDQQLLKDLLPELPLPLKPSGAGPADADGTSAAPRSRMPFADELDETVAAMREVSQRLDDQLLSADTEQLQKGIVTNIDALIEKLQSLPPPSSSNTNSQSDQNSEEQNQTTEKQPQSGSQPESQEAPQEQAGADSSAGSGQQPQAGKAGESSEQNLREARERATALARRRALVDEVWGHLPPTMRERLLNIQGEKLLPEYEDLIRRYYESLAEPDRKRSRR